MEFHQGRDREELFEAYLQQYPSGAFVTLAKLKIAAIEARDKERETAELGQGDLKRAALPQVTGVPPEIAKLEQTTSGLKGSSAPTGQMSAGELTLIAQRELVRVGCLEQVDGKWGSGSQKALQAYAERKGIKLASLTPTEELVNSLKAAGGRVCPLVCGNGMEVRGNRCVAAGLSVFNGVWKLTRHATTDCGDWRELSTSILVNDGVVSSSSGLAGKVARNGTISMTLTFVHKGRKGGNILTGMIKNDKGKGRFKGTGAGSGCSGTVTMSRM